MRKIVSCIIFLFAAGNLSAQYYDDAPQLVLGVEGSKILNSPASNAYLPGVSGTAKLTLPVGDFSDIVFAGSIMAFPGKEYTAVNGKKVSPKARMMAAAMFGYRYYLTPLVEYNTWYVEPRIGLMLDGTKNQQATIAAVVGYLINNKIDLYAKYQAFGGNDKLSFLSLGIGYGFSLK